MTTAALAWSNRKKKSINSSVWTAGVFAKMQIMYLLNTSVKHYHDSMYGFIFHFVDCLLMLLVLRLDSINWQDDC
jgi:hypothetical protein